MPTPTLISLIDATIKRPANEAIRIIGRAARARHEDTCLAVMAYGSGLRDTEVSDTLVDLYVLVSDYRQTYANGWEARANEILPPNVYYLEYPDGDHTIRAKYAVVTLEQFQEKCSQASDNPYFWARFAQPSALLWRRDKATAEAVSYAIARAVETMLRNAAPLAADITDAQQVWLTALSNTYRTEWRAESADRAQDLIAANSAYYEATHKAVFGDKMNSDIARGSGPAGERARARRAWALRRFNGKCLSILRLAKAAFTFQGGPDYLVWKIERHSGTRIELTDWQRRHPILAGLWLLPKLYRAKAIR